MIITEEEYEVLARAFKLANKTLVLEEDSPVVPQKDVISVIEDLCDIVENQQEEITKLTTPEWDKFSPCDEYEGGI